ncbi:hypothetical protein PLESTB_000218800 [Pleodorina starrii]|uniref:Uncharacterized protein n=1 Tax=Pleodorina starrii TaxID=330485 RepID=A0A9W6BC36_9CHLO|nr:hypothetical protein PLESTM_001544500 [Pleodorina starrii]GLC49434.1 hypothetical protein PLESTB_000218800 [Pleodorina starrii]GLC75667.1 hypothetical protein PLESTF_001671800 [Pleodorina starrii]
MVNLLDASGGNWAAGTSPPAAQAPSFGSSTGGPPSAVGSRRSWTGDADEAKSPSAGQPAPDATPLHPTVTCYCLGGSARRLKDTQAALDALASQPVEASNHVSALLTLAQALLNGFFIVDAFVTRPRQHGYWDNGLLQLLVMKNTACMRA